MGHARAILGLADRSEEARAALASKIAAEDLSVRETEQLVKRLNAPKKEKKPAPVRDEQSAAYYAELERKTMKILGRRVKISDGGEGRRRLELDYESADDLAELLTKRRRGWRGASKAVGSGSVRRMSGFLRFLSKIDRIGIK